MLRIPLAVALLLTVSFPAFARSSDDHASVGGNITVAEGETSGDIACAFCSVYVHGDVKGDVAVAFGKVEVDPGRSISGDVAVLGGDLTLGPEGTVGGDVSVAAGDATLGPGAMIHGSRTVLPGRIWLLLPFAPLILLIGLIWLAIYIVRRNRYQFPAYPQGRRY